MPRAPAPEHQSFAACAQREKAAAINPYHSEHFCWVDAGLCLYRSTPAPPSVFPAPDKIARLPRDKFVYSSSEAYNPLRVRTDTYYHHVSGTYLMSRSMIESFAALYLEYLDRLLYHDNIWTDQVVLTHMYKDHPELFHRIGDGYAQVVAWLA